MEISYDLIKRFQFDLEVGILKNVNITMKNSSIDSILRVKNKQELLTITYVLNYIGYEMVTDPSEFLSLVNEIDGHDEDVENVLLIDIPNKKYTTYTRYINTTKSYKNHGIPEYLKGIEVELQ